MRKLVLVLLATAFVFGGLAMVAQANDNNGASGTVEFCKFLEDIGLADNVGQCVKFFRSNDGPAKFCQSEWDAFYIPFFFGREFKNQGDCVSFIRSLD
jgi:hypothetical protein